MKLNYAASGVAIAIGFTQLFSRVAERLCDCRAKGDRLVEPEEHDRHCAYVKLIIDEDGTNETA